MTWRDRLRALFAPEPEPVASAVEPQPVQRVRSGDAIGAARALAGGARAGRSAPAGRVSVDNATGPFQGFLTILPPPDHESNWRLLNLDSDTLDRLSPAKLMEMLADVSPDVSRALWDFLRLSNPGWEAQATRPGSDDPDPRAQAVLDAFLNQLDDMHGAIDVVFARLFLAAWLRGAFLVELVLDQAGRAPVDLATPDPASVRFQKAQDPVRGTVQVPGQWQEGRFVPFDRPTIRYIPIDPFPGSPYGRPIVAPALFAALFLLGVLHDLRRVVQQQGYPRVDLKILAEKIQAAMPPELENDPKAMQEWVGAAIDEVKTVYSQLQPDDAYVHLDAVEVNRPVGTVDSDSLGAVDGLIKALERMLVRALKTMPLMMGTTDGVSEANANRQWEIFAAGIKSLQHLAETLLERLLTLGLQSQGVQASVRFRFGELRAAELLRDAQTEALLIANAAAKRDQGWIGQDEASVEVTGHDAVAPAPIAPAPAAPPEVASAQADPGSNRARLARGRRDVAESVSQALSDLREGFLSSAEDDLANFFSSQADRVVERLRNANRGRGSRTVPPADELLPGDEQDQLRQALEPWYTQVLEGVHTMSTAVLGVSFELDDAVTRAYLEAAGTQIAGIHETTLAAVRDALTEGQAAGESIDQLAHRLRDLPEFGRARARTVARTELGQSSQRAALTTYEASGVVMKVELRDGDYDAECQARNGTRYTLEEARSVPGLAHPNCTAAWLPLT